MFHNILVPLDGSKMAESILNHVEEMARFDQARVILLQVEDAPMMLGRDEVIDKKTYKKTVKKKKQRVKSYLVNIIGDLQERGVEAHYKIGYGSVIKSILETAEEEKVDLIAMVTHGFDGLSRSVFGSVAAGLVQLLAEPGRQVPQRQSPAIAGPRQGDAAILRLLDAKLTLPARIFFNERQAHPDPGFPDRQLEADMKDLVPVGRQLHGEGAGRRLLQPAGSQGRVGKARIRRGYWTIQEVTAEIEGRQIVVEPARVVGFSPVDQLPGVLWLVTVEQDLEEALHPIQSVTRYLWIHFIGVFATVILLALYFSFKLEQPVMDDELHLHEEHIPSSLKARAEADREE